MKKSKPSFYGGKKGFNYVMLSVDRIEGSGSLEHCLKHACENNWAVAKMIPIKFAELQPVTRKMMGATSNEDNFWRLCSCGLGTYTDLVGKKTVKCDQCGKKVKRYVGK